MLQFYFMTKIWEVLGKKKRILCEVQIWCQKVMILRQKIAVVRNLHFYDILCHEVERREKLRFTKMQRFPDGYYKTKVLNCEI